MIKFVKLECPSCGGKIKRNKSGTYTCPFCNSEFIMDREILIKTEKKPELPKRNSYGNYPYIVAIAVIVLIFIFGIIYIYEKPSPKNPSPMKPIVVQKEKITDKFLKYFIQKVYGKEYSDLSDQDYASLTAFGISNGQVNYSLNHGEMIILSNLDTDTYLKNTEELNNFPALEILNIPSYDLKEKSLEGMTNLRALYCNASPETILKSLPNPEKLEKLKCYINKSEEADEISKFNNLIELEVKFYRNVTSLPESFSVLKNLESAKIEGTEITNLSSLCFAVNMKTLDISCQNLKSIDFIQGMNNLEGLNISRSKIVSTDPLKGKNFKKLLFGGSSNNLDYSFISDLTTLEELSLGIKYKETPPSLHKLSNLKKLTISGINDMSEICSLVMLEYLKISNSDFDNFESLSSLQRLEELQVSGEYTFIKGLNVLEQLRKLKIVKFSGVKNFEDNLDTLFNIPNLKELYLDDSLGEVNYANIKTNESLEILNLNKASFKSNVYYQKYGWETDYWYDSNPICEHMEMFAKFPNLKELYLQGQTLSDIQFVEYLPKLELLDITDNNVTDISPLKNLKLFKKILCGNNAISKGLELRDKFEIDDTVEEDIWSNYFKNK